jgi:hypothetical protein
LKRIRPDDIILLHDISPKKDCLLRYWLNEIELILGIEEKGLVVLPLSAYRKTCHLPRPYPLLLPLSATDTSLDVYRTAHRDALEFEETVFPNPSPHKKILSRVISIMKRAHRDIGNDFEGREQSCRGCKAFYRFLRW